MTTGTASPLRVSLVIPSHKRGDRILPTLRSALDQTRPLDEILVINDGGAEETTRAVATLGDRVRVINIPQGGAAEARNTGVKMAAGPIVMLLDDDDLVQPHATEIMLNGLVAFPEAKASFCDHTFTDHVTGEHRPNHFHFLEHYGRFRALTPEKTAPGNSWLFGRNLHEILLRGNLLGQPWMVWKDVYLELGGFVSGLGSADDWDVYLRLTRKYKVVFTDQVASDHFREAGRVHLTTAAGQEKGQLAVALRQIRMAGPFDLEAQRYLRRKIGGHYKSFGDDARAEDPWRARRHYLASLRWWPFDFVAAVRTVFPTL